MSRRRKKQVEPEEHHNNERWMVTYADMLTLLMVLFIVMFAMSQVDQKKYTALKNGLSDGFGATSSLMKGSDSILEGEPKQAWNPDRQGAQLFEQLSPPVQQLVTAVIKEQRRAELNTSYAAVAAEADRLRETQRRLDELLRKHGVADDVSTSIDGRGLVVSLVSRHVVFQANIAELSERGRKLVDLLGPVLDELGNDLRIDGHTNQAAGRPKYFATDWDLSAARALSVLRRLNEIGGIPGERLSLAAFGHERPLLDPRIPRSQRINKRVDIIVLPDIDQSAVSLFGELAAGERMRRERDPSTHTDDQRADQAAPSTEGEHR